jgi:hypothetical protein
MHDLGRRTIGGLVALLPILLAGCSVTWPLAVSESAGSVVIHLPRCSTHSVIDVRLVDETTFEPVWEIVATNPVMGIRDVIVGESLPGFRVVEPLAFGVADDTSYYAEVRFGGKSGPFAEVSFTTADLSRSSWWFEGQAGTPEAFESSAEGSGLCGSGDFSFGSIFLTKFGLACALTMATLTAFIVWLVVRRRRT